MAPPSGTMCSIEGPVFSLNQDSTSDSNQWIVRSPSLQGWQKLGGEIDLKTEWGRFVNDLSQKQRAGCFPPQESVSSITRSIAEKIPLEASEALLFFYLFGGTGFVDLVPGMQIKVEKTIADTKSKQNAVSYFVQYEAVAASDTGVAIEISKQSRRPSAKLLSPEDDFIYGLQTRFATKTMMRLFLESSRKDESVQYAILLGSTTAPDLDSATRAIQKSSYSSCPPAPITTVDCVLFKKGTAVSLLLSVWVNGHPSYRPMGTPLGYILELLPENERARAVETVSLSRPLSNGGYADVQFPRNLEAAQQIILLSGDRINWKQ